MSCCCGAQGGCCGCLSYPQQYQLVVSGITDGTDCDVCNEIYNGTFTLTKVVGLCIWQSSPDVFGCGGFGPAWGLNCDPASGFWYLGANADNSNVCARYRKAIGFWSCLGSNTLDLITDDPDCVYPPPHPPAATCGGWPATMTVVPI